MNNQKVLTLNSNLTPSNSIDYKESLMKKQIDMAKIYADKEVKIYFEALSEFIKKVEDLSIVSSIPGDLFSIPIEMLNVLSTDIFVPILKGFKPALMDNDTFSDYRALMFNNLISKYIRK